MCRLHLNMHTPIPNEVREGWRCCLGTAWKRIRETSSHIIPQGTFGHSYISSRTTMDHSWRNEWYWCAWANLHLTKKKKNKVQARDEWLNLPPESSQGKIHQNSTDTAPFNCCSSGCSQWVGKTQLGTVWWQRVTCSCVMSATEASRLTPSQFAANGKWLKKKKIQKIIWWFYVSQLENLCETYLSCFIECEVIPEDGILIADGFNIASVEQSLSNSNSLLPAKTKKVAEQNTAKPLV